MKKTLSVLLVLSVLLLALAGCADPILGDLASPSDIVTSPSDLTDPAPAPTPSENETVLPDTTDDAAEPDAPAEESPVQEPAADPYEPVDMNVAVLKGPTGMGMAKLMADSANGEAANNYTFTVDSDTSAVLTRLIAGEYDIAALPTNTASVAFNKTAGGIQMLALNTMGTLYLLQNGALESPVPTSIADLEGATITLFGQGANPEYVLTYVLESAGLTVGEDVTLDFCAAVDEVLAKVAAGTCEYALLPEPNASVAQTKNADFSVVMDMNAAWEEASGGETKLVMGCLAVRAEFAQANPGAVAKFLEEYQASVDYILTADDAAALVAAQAIVPNEAIAAKALPNANIVCITGGDMQSAVEGYYHVLFNFNPQAVGGAIPTEAFYYLGE